AGIDPAAFQQVFHVTMTEGRFAPLAADEVVVDRELARTKDIRVGDRVRVVAFGDKTATLTVVGIGDDLAILSLFGQGFVTSQAGFAKLSATPSDFLVGLKVKDGTSVEAMRPALKAELKQFPTMRVQDRDQFTGSLVAQIKLLLNVIYVLLALSIIIALIGIANTLSQSINERTRELGLLRAMGMTRAQLRSTVRWEAVIVALMGTGLGVILGLGLSWILVKGLASQGIDTFSVPTTGLVLEVVFGAGLGIIASLRPAAKAAKLNVLEAIATE
ncbi:MAG: ABC-type transport system, involved in lipoprotein release, permease component, partial [Acidimicrobiales bacterium]|nr:ABC-type transport system, involved in lipoprotein release, permease component [Acidimicrobiales bacterium]